VLAGRVVGGLGGGIAQDQLEPVQDGLVDGVVAAELQGAQQFDQPGPVVVGVGGAEHAALVAAVGALSSFVLMEQVGQSVGAAEHWVDHLAYGFVGRTQGGFGDLSEQGGGVAEVLVMTDESLGDGLVCVGVDLVNDGVEQLHQGVGDLPLALMSQRREEHQSCRWLVGAQVARRGDRGACPPCRDHFDVDSSEQAGR